MSSVEETIDVEAIRFQGVVFGNEDPYMDRDHGKTWRFPVRIHGKSAGHLYRYTNGYMLWNAALYFGDPLTAMIAHGFGNTASEAVTDALTRFVTEKQKDLERIKVMAMLYGDQIAIAASNLEEDNVR